jgi:peptide/nickel transport system ATP-binding protein
VKNDLVLDIKNLTFGYTKEKLLYKNFSLSVKKGEVCAVVGPSGIGKSTLFELITKQLKPIGGKIEVCKVSQIYQDPYTSFHDTYSIIEQIRDVAVLDNLEFFLQKLDIEENLLYKKPFELSGGQLQRCSILEHC